MGFNIALYSQDDTSQSDALVTDTTVRILGYTPCGAMSDCTVTQAHPYECQRVISRHAVESVGELIDLEMLCQLVGLMDRLKSARKLTIN